VRHKPPPKPAAPHQRPAPPQPREACYHRHRYPSCRRLQPLERRYFSRPSPKSQRPSPKPALAQVSLVILALRSDQTNPRRTDGSNGWMDTFHGGFRFPHASSPRSFGPSCDSSLCHGVVHVWILVDLVAMMGLEISCCQYGSF
jgi:hypothetical protein